MPLFEVDGADADTGQNICTRLIAQDEGHAREICSTKRIVVARLTVVTPASDSAASPAFASDGVVLGSTPSVPNLKPRLLGEVRVAQTNWQQTQWVIVIALGVALGIIGSGCFFLMIIAGTSEATMPGSGAKSASPGQPLARATIEVATAPGNGQLGPAQEVGIYPPVRITAAVGMTRGEFECVRIDGIDCVRWRVTMENDSDQTVRVGLVGSVFYQSGREEWASRAWIVTVPPGRHVIERTEPIAGARLTEATSESGRDLRVRSWVP